MDDATSSGTVNFDNEALYARISSAHNMLDPRNADELANHLVWIPFHFLPGNDGLGEGQNPIGSFINKLVCKPDSPIARQMVRQGGGGAIVNMSSVNAVLAIPNQVPYVVSKGGINQLTKVMALALAPHRIRVNAVGPGTILTELAREAVLGNPEAEARILSRTPLGRLGEPSEVARTALFLASDDTSYMTGQALYPDGGRLALNYTVAPATPREAS